MSVYWNFGVYCCGHEFCLGNLFYEWYSYTQQQKYARRLLRAGHQVNRQTSSTEQMVEDGLIDAFASIVVELSPRADQDNEEVGPHHEWPDTDDGF